MILAIKKLFNHRTRDFSLATLIMQSRSIQHWNKIFPGIFLLLLNGFFLAEISPIFEPVGQTNSAVLKLISDSENNRYINILVDGVVAYNSALRAGATNTHKKDQDLTTTERQALKDVTLNFFPGSFGLLKVTVYSTIHDTVTELPVTEQSLRQSPHPLVVRHKFKVSLNYRSFIPLLMLDLALFTALIWYWRSPIPHQKKKFEEDVLDRFFFDINNETTKRDDTETPDAVHGPRPQSKRVKYKSMSNLSSEQKHILADFVLAAGTHTTSSYKRFRIKHEARISTIEQLERDGYIRRDNDYYRVSLIALSEIEIPTSRELLDLAELIFQELKTHYRIDPDEKIMIRDLAGKLDVDSIQVCECLSYMLEGGISSGHSTALLSNPDAYIFPAEAILRFETFGDIIKNFQEQISRQCEDARTLTDAMQMLSTIPAVAGATQNSSAISVPNWVSELPSDLSVLLSEVYVAVHYDLRALASMGLRAVIDRVVVEIIGDAGSFFEKLKKLKEAERISIDDHDLLLTAIKMGNASAHRGFTPDKADLEIYLDIVERLVKGFHFLPKRTSEINTRIPKRETKQN